MFTAVRCAMNPTAHLSGEQLAASLADEEERLPRLDALYARHYPSAVRLAFLLTGDAAAAEDIAQEAFLAIAPRLFGLSSPDAFSAYLRRTLVRRVLMRTRANGREEGRWRRVAPYADQTVVDPTADSATRIDVIVAISALPPRQRTAVVLRYWADLAEEDIAGVLRCRRGTVKSTLSRALDSLRKDLADDDRP